MTWVFAAFWVVAAVDWWAVHTARRNVEVAAKPLALGLLIVAATETAPGDVRGWLLAALTFSLLGDIALLGGSTRRFVAGLVAFLIGHLAYVVGFVVDGQGTPALLGLIVMLTMITTLGRRIVGAVRVAEPGLHLPVVAYIAVISAMVVAAFGTGRWVAALGAVLFYSSDAAIAWTRFVAYQRYGRLFIMATYHLGQGLIVAAYL